MKIIQYFFGEEQTFEDNLLEPVEYFAKYFSAEMIDLIVDEPNSFAVFEKQKTLNITFDEQLMVHGMLIKIGIVNMQRYEMYWSNDYKLDGIAKLMFRNRFYDLLSALHQIRWFAS